MNLHASGNDIARDMGVHVNVRITPRRGVITLCASGHHLAEDMGIDVKLSTTKVEE